MTKDRQNKTQMNDTSHETEGNSFRNREYLENKTNSELKTEILSLQTRLAKMEAIVQHSGQKTSSTSETRLLTRITDYSPGVIFAYDLLPNGKRSVLHIGTGLEGMVGEETAKKIRNNLDFFFELIPDEEMEVLSLVSSGAEKTGKAFDCEFHLTGDERNALWVRVTGLATLLADGIIRWQGVIIDVTKRKEEEKQLIDVFKRFHEMEFEAERLRTASSMAGTIAHEFNNPLAVIRNATDVLLMRDSSDTTLTSMLEKINKQIDRMQELVHNLLEIKEVREIDYVMGDKIIDIHKSRINCGRE